MYLQALSDILQSWSVNIANSQFHTRRQIRRIHFRPLLYNIQILFNRFLQPSSG